MNASHVCGVVRALALYAVLLGYFVECVHRADEERLVSVEMLVCVLALAEGHDDDAREFFFAARLAHRVSPGRVRKRRGYGAHPPGARDCAPSSDRKSVV